MIKNSYAKVFARQFGWAAIAMLVSFAVSCFIFPNALGLVLSLGAAWGLFMILERQRNRSELGWALLRWRVAVGLAAVYFSFATYFWSRNISLRAIGVDQTHPVVMQATSAAYLTALLFLTYYSLRLRHLLGRKVAGKHNALRILSLSLPLFAFVGIMYTPSLAPHFSAGPLNLADWLISLGFTAVFALFLESQHRTKHHTTHGLFEAHGHEKVKKHLPKR